VHRGLAVATDARAGTEYSAFYRVPRTADDLRERSRLIEHATAAGGTLVTLVKEIGSDALFGLLRVLDGDALGRAEDYLRHCRDGDLWQDCEGLVAARYGLTPGGFALIRPDQHLAGCWPALDPDAVTRCRAETLALE